MDDSKKKKVAKSVIKIAKRGEIDKFVTYEAPLTCYVSESFQRPVFHVDQELYNIYMNVINKAFENEQPSSLELDSKL